MKRNIIILILGLIIAVALIETVIIQSFGSTSSTLSLFSVRRFLRFLLFNFAIFALLGGLWVLALKIQRNLTQRRKYPALSLKSKLISVFALVSLIPTVSLIFISHLTIAQSINRWESVSNDLKKLRVLPMAENVREIASDPNFIQALETGADFSGLDFDIPEGYMVAIYDASGNMLLSSITEPSLLEKIASMEEVGLPPVGEFPSGDIVMPREALRFGDSELVLSAMRVQSMEDGRILGVIAVGEIAPSAPADIAKVRRNTIAVFTVTAALIFLIALWVSSLVAREITDPIQKLVAATREVAGGKLDYRVDISARDEVGMLTESFNQMTTRLRQNAEELKRIEKVEAWKEVAQKLAHEIKNPLTPIRLSAERIQRRYYSKRNGYEEILKECTSTIIDEVERLRKLLDEFSQFARMPIANPEPSDINTIAQEALKLYGEFPEAVKVETDFAVNLPQVEVDASQIERAFFNIIKNAVEAMENGGILTIKTRMTGNTIEVEFADTGMGIPPDMMQKLFTPHFSTKRGGTGLGLAIVKKIINDHGGDVIVISEPEKGTSFIISIPVSEGANDGR